MGPTLLTHLYLPGPLVEFGNHTLAPLVLVHRLILVLDEWAHLVFLGFQPRSDDAGLLWWFGDVWVICPVRVVATNQKKNGESYEHEW